MRLSSSVMTRYRTIYQNRTTIQTRELDNENISLSAVLQDRNRSKAEGKTLEIGKLVLSSTFSMVVTERGTIHIIPMETLIELVVTPTCHPNTCVVTNTARYGTSTTKDILRDEENRMRPSNTQYGSD